MGVSRPEPAANGAVLASSDLSLPFLVVDGEGMEGMKAARQAQYTDPWLTAPGPT